MKLLALAVGGGVVLAVGLLLGVQFLAPWIEEVDEPAGLSVDHDNRVAESGEGSRDAETIESPPYRNAPPPLKILVPAYFYPAGPGLEDWLRLIDAADRVAIVAVVNPGSGPGEEINHEYADVIGRGIAAGLTMIGYVNTEFAMRPRSEIEGEIDRWVEFYPQIQGIFLDAQSSSAGDVDFYSALHEFANRKIDDALVATNPGRICPEEYFNKAATDVAVIFENSGGFEEFYPPLWSERYPPDRFAALPYSVETVGEMGAAVQQAVRKRIGYLYVCDGAGENPWAGLPPYWDELLDAIEHSGEIDSNAAP